MNLVAPISDTGSDDVADIVASSASRLFKEIGLIGSSSAQGAGLISSQVAWSKVEESGFGFAMLHESLGGIDVLHAFNILRLAGVYCVALPLAESMGANWMLVAAGLDPAPGALTFAEGELDLTADSEGYRVRGTLLRVPWARMCDVVCIGRREGVPQLLRIARGTATVIDGQNIAGEPRDTCIFDARVSVDQVSRLPDGFSPTTMRQVGAAIRTAQMAGAMNAALDLTVGYSQQRRQFGHAIAAFQAMQQLIAVMATQVAAAGVASSLAAGAFDKALDPLAIAAAKVRSGEAAGVVASIAHQVHGAIGFTREHSLHLLTRRLWAWRDDYGGEGEWAVALGRSLISGGHSHFWERLTEIRPVS